MIRWLVFLLPLALLLVPMSGMSPSHYLPGAGDSFHYAETIVLSAGTGNYTGYSENSNYNGSIAVTSVLPNGTESATYQASGTFRNSTGTTQPWSERGTFTFSATTFHYVRGTDNQTGYVNPYVWFYMDNSLGQGSTFFILNTPMNVVSTSYPYPNSLSPTGYVRTIFAEGNGSHQRNDVYGKFTASYQWQEFFDISTGYVVGYSYSETDSDRAGDGFVWTDTLSDTQTTFGLTAAPAPPMTNIGSSSALMSTLLFSLVFFLPVTLGLAAIIVWIQRKKAARLQRHPTAPIPGTLPSYAPPPPVDLIPRDQPLVQQVVIRETVKVPCRFCGTLIDSTALACPKCGAPRT